VNTRRDEQDPDDRQTLVFHGLLARAEKDAFEDR
jgi:hypothetical protein